MAKCKQIVFYLVILTIFGSNCFAFDRTFIQDYNKGNFHKAKHSIKIALQKNPDDALAYYYLGHINIKLNDTQAARRAYYDGLKICTDRVLSKRFVTALKSMAQTSNTGKKSPVTHKKNSTAAKEKNPAPAQEKKSEPKYSAFNGEDPEKFEDRLSKTVEEKKNAILKDLEKRIAERKVKLDATLAHLKRLEAQYHSTMSQNKYPGYPRTNGWIDVTSIKSIHKLRMEQAQKDYEKWVKKQEGEAQAKVERLLHTRHSLSQHYQKATGTTRLTPKGSSLNIRNYVNFNGYQKPTGKKTTEKMGKLGDHNEKKQNQEQKSDK